MTLERRRGRPPKIKEDSPPEEVDARVIREERAKRLAESALAVYNRDVKGEDDPAMALLPPDFLTTTRHTSMRDRAMLNRLFRAKRLGMPDTKACAIAGVSKWTVVEWKQAATEEIDRRDKGEPPDRTRDDVVIFYVAYSVATHAPLEAALEVIHDSVLRGNVDAARWVAERMAPEEYAPSRRVDVNNLHNVNISNNPVAQLAPQRLDMLSSGENDNDIIDALAVEIEDDDATGDTTEGGE